MSAPEWRAEGGAPTLWGWRTYASMALALAMLVAMAFFVDLREVADGISQASTSLVVLGLLAHYATYPVRGYRWKHCLARTRAAGARTGRFGLVVFFYNFVDNLVPAKLGDLYAAHMARINFGIRRSAALGSLVFVRMVDAWVVLGFAVLASWALFSSKLPTSVIWGLAGGLVLAVAATALLVAVVFLHRSVPEWIPAKGRRMLAAFHAAMLPPRSETLPVAGSTALVWLLEATWMFALLRGFGVRPGPAELVFVTTLPLLASTFPFTPSGAGVVELALFGCLRIIGVPAPLAASITVLNRFIDYWLHIGLGILAWGIRGRLGLRTWRTSEATT